MADVTQPRRINLADPDFEPTDEELQELAHRAFAGVAAQNAEGLRRIHADIEAQRAILLKKLEARRAEYARK